MAARLYSVVVDCHDHRAQAAWWAKALGWRVFFEDDQEAVVLPPHFFREGYFTEVPPHERGVGMVFVPVPEGKTVKNRIHVDLAPEQDDDHEAEVQRVLDLGARRVDVGQRDVPWVVLADPEGNEFCILTPRDV